METISILFLPQINSVYVFIALFFLHFCYWLTSHCQGMKRTEKNFLKCPWFIIIWKWNSDRHRHRS